MRLELQLRLFKLRDKLRTTHFDADSRLEPEVYSTLQEAINFSIRYVATISVFDLMVRPRLSAKESAKVSEIAKSVSNSRCAEAPKIQRELVRIWLRAMGANSLGWAIYVVPPVLCAIAYRHIKRYVKTLIFIPDRNLFGAREDYVGYVTES